MKTKIMLGILFLFINASASTLEGEKLFKEFCWGCHHETSMAFGPSFQQIANTRNSGQIISHIADPKNTYEQLGYKRSVMPEFKNLTQEQLQALSEFIQSFKD
jgi:mono/diheme cytochrome c family protein